MCICFRWGMNLIIRLIIYMYIGEFIFINNTITLRQRRTKWTELTEPGKISRTLTNCECEVRFIFIWRGNDATYLTTDIFNKQSAEENSKQTRFVCNLINVGYISTHLTFCNLHQLHDKIMALYCIFLLCKITYNFNLKWCWYKRGCVRVFKQSCGFTGVQK